MLAEDLSKQDRNDWIDCIRGVSILCVLLLHIEIRLPFENTSIGKMLPDQLNTILFHSGYYGVIVFFVVSGFLITSNVLKRWGSVSNIHCVQFYQMRFARIVPCLLTLIVVLSALNILNVRGFVVTKTSLEECIFAALTFHVNWLEAKVGYLQGSWDVLWSLSIEEMFYLFFPLLCLFVRKEWFFKIILVIFILLGPFARCNSSNDIWADHSYLSCMDGIAIGCLAALYANQIKPNYINSFLFSGLVLFALVFFCRHFVAYLGFTKMGLNITMLDFSIAFMLIALNKKSVHFIVTKPLQWFGRNSYEIYLTHIFIVMAIMKIFADFNFSMTSVLFFYFVIVIVSGLVGTCVSKYFSEPINTFLRFKLQLKEVRILKP